MSKKEDLKYRQQFNEEKEGTLSNVATGFKHGSISAWNFFNLQRKDIINKSNRDLLAVEQIERFDKKPNVGMALILKDSIEEKEEEMKPYREAELKNLREYQAFYENIDNAPARFLTSLSYGAAKNTLNPIEFGKNTAFNAMTLGSGVALNIGFQILLDTTDNLLMNRYEDELLGKTREDNAQALIEAGGGAILGNLLFPAIRWGGRKIKGAMSIDNILDDNFINFNARDLKNIDILDFDDPDPKVTFKNKKYVADVTKKTDIFKESEKAIKNFYENEMEVRTENGGTFGVNLKHEIKATRDMLETGYDSTSAVNFREMVDDIIELGHQITTEAVKNKTKLEKKLIKQGKSILEASKEAPMDRKSINVNIERNVKGMINNYIDKPIKLYEEMYKTEYHKAIRDISYKYDDAILNIGPFKRSVNERLAEDLADNTVVDTVLDSVFTNTRKFAPKSESDIDGIKLGEFGNKIVSDFRKAIGLAVTHNTEENIKLFASTPKYEKYIYQGTEQSIFDIKIDKAVSDFLNGDLDVREFSKILFYQKDKYNFFNESKSLGESFENYILKNMNRKIDRKEIGKYKIQLKSLMKKGKFDIESVKKILDDVREKKVNTAIMSLGFNKEQIFDFFIKNDDFTKVREILGNRVNLIKRAEGETQEEAVKRFIKDLRITTNWKKELNQDLSDISFDETVSRDLIDVIKDSFIGKDTKQKMGNFAEFAEFWKNDNITMLNMMEAMTTTEKASITALGVPFYRLKNAINDKEGFLKLFYDIPVLRKDYDKIVKAISGERAIADDVQKKFLEVLKNYVERKDQFKKTVQSNPIDTAEKAVFWGIRNYFLVLSGAGEVLQHPALTAAKGTEYFDGNFFKSAYETSKITPRAVGLTMLREFKPIAGMGVSLNKFYKGLGALIGGDDGELLASLETARFAEIITPRKNGSLAVEGIKGMAGIVQDFALHLQGSMQNLRFFSSQLLAVQKIKQLLTYDKFESLSLEDQKRFKIVYIDNDTKFQAWKNDLKIINESGNNVGLISALYKNGFSDETKYLRSSMAYDLYAEDPLKNLKKPEGDKSFFLNFRTVFTTFTNDLLNYGWDKLNYYRDKKGIYRNRLSTAYLKHIKDNPKETALSIGGGVASLTLLSIAGMARPYIDSKIFQKSDDEKIQAKIKAVAYSADKGKYLRPLAIESVLSGTGLDAFSMSPSGIGDMFETMWKNKFVPRRVDSVYNAWRGTPVYNKPYNMDWYTKALYNKEIEADVRKRAGLEKEQKQTLEEFFKVMDTAYTEVLEENGDLSKGSGVERKRELLGYDDKKEVKKIKNSENYKVIETISLIQSNPQNIENNFANNIEEIQEKNMINGKRKMFMKAFGITEKGYDAMKKQVELTEEEKKKLKRYMDSLDEKDEFWRMMKEVGYKSYLLNTR